jgi:hypothetical protein
MRVYYLHNLDDYICKKKLKIPIFYSDTMHMFFGKLQKIKDYTNKFCYTFAALAKFSI